MSNDLHNAIRTAQVRAGENAVIRSLHDRGICAGPGRCQFCAANDVVKQLEDALIGVRLLWQNCCTSTEFNDGVKALVAAADDALEALKKR